jgi:hypothetical protein
MNASDVLELKDSERTIHDGGPVSHLLPSQTRWKVAVTGYVNPFFPSRCNAHSSRY